MCKKNLCFFYNSHDKCRLFTFVITPLPNVEQKALWKKRRSASHLIFVHKIFRHLSIKVNLVSCSCLTRASEKRNYQARKFNFFKCLKQHKEDFFMTLQVTILQDRKRFHSHLLPHVVVSRYFTTQKFRRLSAWKTISISPVPFYANNFHSLHRVNLISGVFSLFAVRPTKIIRTPKIWRDMCERKRWTSFLRYVVWN